MKIVRPRRFPPLPGHLCAYVVFAGLGTACIVFMGRESTDMAIVCGCIIALWTLLVLREIVIAARSYHLRCRIEGADYDRETKVLVLRCVIYSVKQNWRAENVVVAEVVLNNSSTMGMPKKVPGISTEVVHSDGTTAVVIRGPLELPKEDCPPGVYTGVILLRVRGRRAGAALGVTCMFPVLKTARANFEVLGREGTVGGTVGVSP